MSTQSSIAEFTPFQTQFFTAEFSYLTSVSVSQLKPPLGAIL